MKTLVHVIAIMLLISLGCEKSDDDKNDNQNNCSESTFNVEIQNSMIPVAVAEDSKNNVYVLGSENDSGTLYKLDKNGSIIWKKDSVIIDEVPAQLIILEDNTVVVLSYKENEIDSNLVTLPDLIWVQNGYRELSPCWPNYESGGGNTWEYTVNGSTFLTGLNADGDVLWRNTYDKSFAEGKSMCQDEKNFYLLNMHVNGKKHEKVFDGYGVFQDTVNFPYDRNTAYLTKLNSDGGELWQKEISGLFNPEYTSITTPIDMVGGENKVIIKTSRDIIIVDEDGVILSRQELIPSECTNLLYSMTGDQQSIFISGMYKKRNPSTYQIEEHPYLKRLDEAGNVVWTQQNNRLTGHFHKDRFISEANGYLTLMNKDGIELWSLSVGYSIASIVNCAKGVTIAYSNSNSISVIRTDTQGSY